MMNPPIRMLVVLGFPAQSPDEQFFTELSNSFNCISIEVLKEPLQNQLDSLARENYDIFCFFGYTYSPTDRDSTNVLLNPTDTLDFNSFSNPESALGEAFYRNRLKLVLIYCLEGLKIALTSEGWPRSRSIIFGRPDPDSFDDDIDLVDNIVKQFLENLLNKYKDAQKSLENQAIREVWQSIKHEFKDKYSFDDLPIFFQGRWHQSRNRSFHLNEQDSKKAIYLDDYWRFFACKALQRKIKLTTEVICNYIPNSYQTSKEQLDIFNQVYIPSKFGDSKPKEIFKLIKNQSPRDRNTFSQHRIAIIGEQGAGKTTFLQKMAQWVFEETHQDISIYISLKELQEKSLEDYLIENWLGEEVGLYEIGDNNQEIYREKLKNLFKTKRVWLFLDGVDEIDNPNPYSVIENGITTVEQWAGNPRSVKIILSCRLNLWNIVGNPLYELSSEFLRYSPKEFQYPDDVNLFISKWFKSHNESNLGEKLKKQLETKTYDRIKNLICRPFFVTGLCIFWKLDKQLINRQELYKFLIYLLYIWKQNTDYHTTFREETPEQKKLEKPLSELALAVLREDGKTLGMSRETVDKYLVEETNSLKSLAEKLGILNFYSGSNEYYFSDNFFHIYYAVQAIKSHKDIIDFESHTYHIFDPKWQDVIELWFDFISELEKNYFINDLQKFKDEFTDDNFYLYRLYLFLFNLIVNSDNELTYSNLRERFIRIIINITGGQQKNYRFVIQEMAKLGFDQINTLNVIKDEAKQFLLKVDEQLIIKNIENTELQSQVISYFHSLRQTNETENTELEKFTTDSSLNLSNEEGKNRLEELFGQSSVRYLEKIIENADYEDILYFVNQLNDQNEDIIRKSVKWKLTQYLSPLKFCKIFNPNKYNQLVKPQKETLAMNMPGSEQRLQDLDDNIKREQALLNECRKQLSFIRDPLDRARYEDDVKRIQVRIDEYKQEYNEIQQELTQSSFQTKDTQDIKKKLEKIDKTARLILSGQVATYKLLSQTHQDLLARYQESEQVIIGEITKELKDSELKLTQNLLEAVETNQVSDVQMQQMLTLIEQQLSALAPAQSELITEIIKDPELDLKHRLTVSLPVIPLLVNYEAEIELGTGFNLSNTWEWLTQKLRR